MLQLRVLTRVTSQNLYAAQRLACAGVSAAPALPAATNKQFFFLYEIYHLNRIPLDHTLVKNNNVWLFIAFVLCYGSIKLAVEYLIRVIQKG